MPVPLRFAFEPGRKRFPLLDLVRWDAPGVGAVADAGVGGDDATNDRGGGVDVAVQDATHP
jgi:hypothetical protein